LLLLGIRREKPLVRWMLLTIGAGGLILVLVLLPSKTTRWE
jgi:hypothetical protein